MQVYDVTKIVDLVSRSDQLAQQAKQRQQESSDLLRHAQKECPHMAVLTEWKPHEDEYGKALPDTQITTCATCRKLISES